MRNTFCKTPLWECHRRLAAVAQGRQAADAVIRDCRWVNVNTGEVIEHTDIALASGRIAYVGPSAERCTGPDTVVTDAAGAFATPGLLDGHMHVESAMVGVGEYARAVLPHGTTGVYMDPHEVANVRGLRGVSVMMDDAGRVPLKAMLTTPSCVPAVPGFEDTGAEVTPEQVEETMKWDCCVGLGEVMNFPGVLADDDAMMEEIAYTLAADKTVTGHYSVPETDAGLNAYIASGVSACHESVRAEDALAKVRLGMYAQLRGGSAWCNLPDLMPAFRDGRLDTRFCCIVTDDNHPNTLMADGHLDRNLREAVALGLDPVTAVQMCTINTATCFGQQRDLGSIAPGKCADIVLWEDLEGFRALKVWVDGELVAEDGRCTFELDEFLWPDFMTATMNLGFEPGPETFQVPARDEKGATLPDGTVTVRAIQVSPGQTITRELRVPMEVRDGLLEADPGRDLLKLCVIERHNATQSVGRGFVRGFGIHGALAQTVGHDAHNLVVLGDNDEDMAVAARTLARCGGGEVAVVDGEVRALVELPVCGIMSDLHVAQVAEQVAGLQEAWAQMGCQMPSPFMTLGGISLACIPELRLTNRGYVDCVRFCPVPLV